MPKEVKKRSRQNRESKKFLTDAEQSDEGEIKNLIIQQAERLGIEPTLVKKFSNSSTAAWNV